MSTPPVMPWDAWFPSGLDPETATGIGEQWWAEDPHWASYLAWTAYAATLPLTVSVSSVGTGVQTVQYSPAMPTGEYGTALARAEWHRNMSGYGGLVSVPCTTVRVSAGPPLAEDVWPIW